VLRQVHNIGRRRAWVIWLVGLSVYVLAVFHRTSLGVAGLLAAERFHISAAQLATFTVVQLSVYAAMQIPVGVLIDRFGPRVLMLAGTVLMVAGQLTLAFAPSITIAVVGRMLVGAGDATIFTDNFAGGKDIRLTNGSLNPTSMTFKHIVGTTPANYRFTNSGSHTDRRSIDDPWRSPDEYSG